MTCRWCVDAALEISFIYIALTLRGESYKLVETSEKHDISVSRTLQYFCRH